MSIILASTIPLSDIAIIGSAGFLLIFSIVNISAYKLATNISANKGVLMLAILLSSLALVTLLFHTYTSNPQAVFVFFTFIVMAIVFELFYGRWVRGHFMQREYEA